MDTVSSLQKAEKIIEKIFEQYVLSIEESKRGEFVESIIDARSAIALAKINEQSKVGNKKALFF